MMLVMFLGFYCFLYFLIKSVFDFFIKSIEAKNTQEVLIVGQSKTAFNFKKLNKTKRASDSLSDLLDQDKKDSAEEIAKRLG